MQDVTEILISLNAAGYSLLYFCFVFFFTLSEILIVISCDANRRVMIDSLEQKQEKSVSFLRLQALFYCFLSPGRPDWFE